MKRLGKAAARIVSASYRAAVPHAKPTAPERPKALVLDTPPGTRAVVLRHVGESTVAIRTTTGGNAREHHMARHRRVGKEREAGRWAVVQAIRTAQSLTPGLVVRPPYLVTLTRIGPMAHQADTDGTVGGLKAVRDGVADALGLDDSPRSPVQWAYASERGPWGVRVRIDLVLSEDA